MIYRGLPTVGDLRSYIARELRIRDPVRLRLHATPTETTKGGRIHLMNDTVTLKDAGLYSDSYIVAGWVDGLWVRNLLPGLNYGRNFFLCIPGLDSGKARVGNIRILVAQKLQVPDSRMIRLFVEDEELLDDRRTTEQESLHWAETDTATNDRQVQCRIVLEDLSSAKKPWRRLHSVNT